MTFASKYEILESVTSGSIETFVARILASKERVLVHIFECPEQEANQPTVQWVMESFHAIAPDPPGLVLATGKYSGTTYAYLVTKLPEDAVLAGWVRSYQQQVSPTGVSAGESSATASPAQVRESTDDSATMARLPLAPSVLLDGKAQVGPNANDAAITGDAWLEEVDKTAAFSPVLAQNESGSRASGSQAPGEFTREFFPQAVNAPAQEPHLPATRSERASVLASESFFAGDCGANPEPTKSVAHAVSPSDTPSDSFDVMPPATAGVKESGERQAQFAGSRPDPSQAPPNAPPATVADSDGRATNKTGEFSRLFHGPFHGEEPAEIPVVSTEWAAPREEVGEFTKVFGKGTSAAASKESPRPAGETSALRNREDPSTPPFERSPQRADSNPAPSQSTDILEAQAVDVAESTSRTFPAPSPEAVDRPRDLPHTPPVGMKSVREGDVWLSGQSLFTYRMKKEAATNVFAAPGSEPAAAVPSGPSEFTKVMSGGLGNPIAAEEVAPPAEDFLQKSAAADIASMPGPLAAPPTPKQFPAGGSFAHASPPTIGNSALPKTPKAQATPKATATPRALVLVMGGLFLLAVLLVLYFAIKH